MAYGGFGRAGQQFKELLLISGFNGEDIDQREKFAARRDRCHRRTRDSDFRKDSPTYPRSLCDDWLAGGVPSGLGTSQSITCAPGDRQCCRQSTTIGSTAR